ncbi:class I SAM-dependent methyltransferase [Orrella daihaiensis]|uniref:SAM-dependent methyltransferase n=1 Tax=Orrella daihaiensis TaxID=2782176 RepID=A0ABY4AMM4_9BURK|nr:SAM-dependent methyltransferase [Orrella daihaiensis]UOD49294.1 SAM-dependent methyltransferase [Orrella daihaiensis]
MNTTEFLPGQSEALLKALHILTRDGKLNQDSRRKLKQVNHLFQFIKPLLEETQHHNPAFTLVDHGAGKSYLGFILVDLYFKQFAPQASVIGIERRQDLVLKAEALAKEAAFTQMRFLALNASDAVCSPELPSEVEIVTALHACDTATDDAIAFGLAKQAKHIVVVPCCQAEVAAALRQSKRPYDDDPLSELWRRPIHTREFGSHLTNTLRCLQLEAHGYQVTVTELVGWEHALKNELIIAKRKGKPQQKSALKLQQMLDRVGLPALADRFFVPADLNKHQEIKV